MEEAVMEVVAMTVGSAAVMEAAAMAVGSAAALSQSADKYRRRSNSTQFQKRRDCSEAPASGERRAAGCELRAARGGLRAGDESGQGGERESARPRRLL